MMIEIYILAKDLRISSGWTKKFTTARVVILDLLLYCSFG